MPLIRSKPQYLALALAGQAGNCPKMWTDPDRALAETDHALIGVRALQRGSRKFTPFIPRGELHATLAALHFRPGEYFLYETVTPDEVRLQGELGHINGAWTFYHSFVPEPMRSSLAKGGRHAVGHFAVWGLLARFCSPAELEHLRGLFERYTHCYETPVIELTVAKHDWGIFPGLRVIVWEVRHY